MPFTVEPQPGETLYLHKEFRGSHGHVFAMAVSTQAIYLPAQKMTLKRDYWYFKRIPISEVVEVALATQKSIYIYLLSFAMVVFGALTGYLLMAPVLRGEPGRVSGWPLAFFVAGLVLPFIARGRTVLLVKMRKGSYKWKPQLAIDRKTRKASSDLQKEIVEACDRAGIPTVQN